MGDMEREGHVKVEDAVTCPQAKNTCGSQELGRGRNNPSPELFRGNTALPTP